MDAQHAMGVARAWLPQPFDENHAWSVAHSLEGLLPDAEMEIFLPVNKPMLEHFDGRVEGGVFAEGSTASDDYLIQIAGQTVYRAMLIFDGDFYYLDVDSISLGAVALDHITEHWTRSAGAEFRNRRWVFRYGFGPHVVTILSEEHVNSSAGPDEKEAFARALNEGGTIAIAA